MNDLFPPAEALSHHADADAVDSVIAWRKARKKPLTDRAAKMVAKTLADINAAGGDATEALDMVQERGWLTVKSEWYWNDKNGNKSNNSMAGAGRANGNAGTLEINAAARIRRPSSGDCF